MMAHFFTDIVWPDEYRKDPPPEGEVKVSYRKQPTDHPQTTKKIFMHMYIVAKIPKNSKWLELLI